MPFISYAQNFEDVMLWRALKHIQNGTYVDIGAQHPIIDSVSKAFYDNGWRGLHIEPVQKYADLLRQYRPDETTLQVALGEHEGTLELTVIHDTGLSTGVKEYAEKYALEHGFNCEKIITPLLTINSALQSLKGQPIHWLKIDVEGFEHQILKTWDCQILRPWIMVIEATEPLSITQKHHEWDPILTEAGYIFVYFDGLNRFYVAKEHAELIHHFSTPPNVFDTARLSGLGSAEWCNDVIEQHSLKIFDNERLIEQLERKLLLKDKELQNSHTKIEQLEENLRQKLTQQTLLKKQQQKLEEHMDELNQISHSWHIQASQANQRIRDLILSRSWRITKPLRFISSFIRSPQNTSNLLIQKMANWTLSQTFTRIIGLKIYAALPNYIQHKLQQIIKGTPQHSPSENNSISKKILSINDLSPDAKAIYKKLTLQSTENK